MQQRIKFLQSRLPNAGLDALIVTEPANIFYLTGIRNFDAERGFLLVVTAAGWKVITSRFYQARVEEAMGAKNVIYVERGGSMSETALLFIGEQGRVGFERESISYAQFEVFKKVMKKKKLVPAAGLVEKLRLTKDKQELSIIKKAAAITDKAFAQALVLIKPGATELEIKRKITEMMQDMGAAGGSFEPIVASGKNAADPHYEGTNKKIKNGEMVVIDIGARYKNYDADMTRTVFVGKATARYKKIYDLVLQAQLAALKDCVIGAPVARPYDNCVANFKKYGEDRYFTHGLGHGVGIQIHENPSLEPAGQGNFGDGMVFTVEPGLYHPGWGGVRIEDLCVIAGRKTAVLSKSPKILIELAS